MSLHDSADAGFTTSLDSLSMKKGFDIDPLVTSEVLRKLLANHGQLATPTSLTLNNLEMVFARSVALGFTLWQHMAALERLSGLTEWTAKNQEHLRLLKNGSRLCGLATTHLGSARGPAFKPEFKPDEFVLTGRTNWVTGGTFFDDLILGFENEAEVFFVLTPFPRAENARFEVSDLHSLGSSATGTLELDRFRVPKNLLISSREKAGVGGPRMTSLRLPELGVAKGIIKRIAAIADSRPDKQFLREGINQLNRRLAEIEKIRNSSAPAPTFQAHSLIRDAAHIFVIAEGSSSMNANSASSRLLLETSLFDVVLQSPEVLAEKVYFGESIVASNH